MLQVIRPLPNLPANAKSSISSPVLKRQDDRPTNVAPKDRSLRNQLKLPICHPAGLETRENPLPRLRRGSKSKRPVEVVVQGRWVVNSSVTQPPRQHAVRRLMLRLVLMSPSRNETRRGKLLRSLKIRSWTT